MMKLWALSSMQGKAFTEWDCGQNPAATQKS